MAIPKGGRGKRAPYATVHYRIPEPLYDLVRAISNQYKLFATGDCSDCAEQFVEDMQSAAALVANKAIKPGNRNSNRGDFEGNGEKLLADLAELTRKIEANERGYRANSASKLRAELIKLVKGVGEE